MVSSHWQQKQPSAHQHHQADELSLNYLAQLGFGSKYVG